MKYKLTGDYHTHTVFSHGKGTIRENVLHARQLGLKAIAITDHGPGHNEHGMKRESVPEMRRIVTELNNEFDDIKVYLGVEANINNLGNGLDIRPDEFSQYDFVIAGYHYGVDDAYCLENFRTYSKGIRSKDLIMKNTQMVLNALYENDLKILTHPGDKAYFDMHEIAKACADTNTLMEINAQHAHLSVKDIKICAKTDAKFIISSDAHKPEKVGNLRLALLRAKEAHLDLERIVNLARVEK